jgi:hypothetical protein
MLSHAAGTWYTGCPGWSFHRMNNGCLLAYTVGQISPDK